MTDDPTGPASGRDDELALSLGEDDAPLADGEALPSDADERAAEARRVADRLRRRKRALERRNPLNDLDGYRERFREVVALEARLRRLRDDRQA